MEDIVIIILQVLFDLIIDIILNFPIYLWPDVWNGTPWSKRPAISAGSPPPDSLFNPIWNSFVLFLLGSAIGGVSLRIYSHVLISVSFLRVANIIYAPILSGGIAYFVALLLSQDKPLRRFCYAFFFTIGLAAVRFAFAHR